MSDSEAGGVSTDLWEGADTWPSPPSRRNVRSRNEVGVAVAHYEVGSAW